MDFEIIRRIEYVKKYKIKGLNLSSCNLFELPQQLTEIEWLEQLDISNNDKLLDINLLEKLPNLYILNISNTKIKNLKPIKNLEKLASLDASNTQISDLAPIGNLLKLAALNVSNTYILDLSPIKNLKKLTTLNASNTKINNVKSIKELYNLKYLCFSHTPLVDINCLSQLEELKVLDIAHTKVKNLSPLQNLVKNKIPIKIEKYVVGEGVYVINCPLENPPKEIVQQGSDSILRYWGQIEQQQGTVELYEAKLIIVGEGGTGKTTLFEKLKDNNHQVGNTPETHGINIHEGLPFTHPLIGNNTFFANLWDFGGQVLQYMTHQFFLTPRALYVLMMDARRESPNLSYWFKIISLLGRDNVDSNEKVKLLLVFNKRGNSTGMPQYQDQLKYYADSLEVEFLEVDFAENDHRFENLQKTIQKALVTLPIVKSQLPRLWTNIRENLRKEANSKNYIHTDRFSEICSTYGIRTEADQWLLSSYLHQLGTLLHFQNDNGLRSQVILNPQWAVDGVYSFLSEEIIIRNRGQFSDVDFISLLAIKGYPRSSADVILQLMTKNNFDICYQASPGNYIAAQLLPENAPEYDWYPQEVLKFWFQYPIMPKGLMSRLIVRLSDFIEEKLDVDGNPVEQIVWKKGVVLRLKLKEGECRVRLFEDDAESKEGLRKIHIEVMGDRNARKYALRKVRDEVENLHKKWFRSIKADEIVPCCCSECAFSDHPQTHKLENLLKRQTKRKDTSCDFSGEDVLIQTLLEGVYDQTEIREMVRERQIP